MSPPQQAHGCAVLIFTRSPKTERKSLGLEPQARARAAQAMIAHTLETVRSAVRASAAIVLATDDESFAACQAGISAELTCLTQRGTDFESRLVNAIDDIHALGYRRVVVVGTDTPDLNTSDLESALQSTAGTAVIGPACDGGFYLLALDTMRTPLLRGLPWCRSTVRACLQRRLLASDVVCRLLAPHHDIDTPHDVRVWRAQLESLCRVHLGIPLHGALPCSQRPGRTVPPLRSHDTRRAPLRAPPVSLPA